MTSDVGAVPGFHGRLALQVLVRAYMVVPDDELGQRGHEGLLIWHAPAVELLFQRAEEALDAAVLPRAMAFDGLVFDAELHEHEVEQRGVEDGFIVGAYGLGDAVALDGIEQLAQDRDRGFVGQGFEAEAAAGAMIDHAEQDVCVSFLVGFADGAHPVSFISHIANVSFTR